MSHKRPPPERRDAAQPRVDGASLPQSRSNLSIGAPGDRFEFYWDARRLRSLAWRVLVATAIVTAIAQPWHDTVRWGTLALMLVFLLTSRAISKRSSDHEPVVVIDRTGICDRRIAPAPIPWTCISAIAPYDPISSRALDIYVALPETTLAHARPSARLGARLQKRTGVPALTISLLLLDADVTRLTEAIGTFRPALVYDRE